MFGIGACLAMGHLLSWDLNAGIRGRGFRKEFYALRFCVRSSNRRKATSIRELPTPAEVFREVQQTVVTGQVRLLVTIRDKIKELEAKGDPADAEYIRNLRREEAETVDTIRKWGGKLAGDD